MSADFSVKITVRNGRLLAAIRSQYGTSSNMFRMTGVSKTVLAAFLTMKQSPLLRTGDWSKAAYDVSSALRMEPEELWPAHVAKIKLLRNEAEIDMSVDEVQDMISDGTYSPAMKALARWTRTVSPRGMQALVMQANGATLDEMGHALGVSRPRAAQIAEVAKRKIKTAAHRDGVKRVEDVSI